MLFEVKGVGEQKESSLQRAGSRRRDAVRPAPIRHHATDFVALVSGHHTLIGSMANLIHDNVLSCIGATPLVRLDKIAKEEGFKCNLLGKLEYFNAGGSVKVCFALARTG